MPAKETMFIDFGNWIIAFYAVYVVTGVAVLLATGLLIRWISRIIIRWRLASSHEPISAGLQPPRLAQ